MTASASRAARPKPRRRRVQPQQPQQSAVTLHTWGGSRPGAGRKPNGQKAGVSHLRRAPLRGDLPVHVTLRVREGLPSLRQRAPFRQVHLGLVQGRERFGFRLCEYSVQADHIHLIIEATDRRALARGIQGLSIRIARAINRSLDRRGPVFADRYDARPLRTPREVRLALRIVLPNAADLCSSAASFRGWLGQSGAAATPLVTDDATVQPRTWLLRVGWRKAGRLTV